MYSTDAFDDDNEVSGLERVVIVELKRGGSAIGDAEKDQAQRYAREIRRTGRVSRETAIVAYVLGTTVEPLAEDVSEEGNTRIIPRRYSDVLRQAHARTFHLLKRIEAQKWDQSVDPELEAVINPTQLELGESQPIPHGEVNNLPDQNFQSSFSSIDHAEGASPNFN